MELDGGFWYKLRRNRMPGEKGRQRPALKAARRTNIVLGIELEVIRVTV